MVNRVLEVIGIGGRFIESFDFFLLWVFESLELLWLGYEKKYDFIL